MNMTKHGSSKTNSNLMKTLEQFTANQLGRKDKRRNGICPKREKSLNKIEEQMSHLSGGFFLMPKKILPL